MDDELEHLEAQVKHQTWVLRIYVVLAIATFAVLAITDNLNDFAVVLVLCWSLQASLDTKWGQVTATKAALNSLRNPPPEGD